MESHKKWVQEVFDRAAPTYGEKENPFFGYFGQRLVAQAQLNAGARVLDVATGKGAVLLPAAQAVGDKGKVIGVDLSLGMIEELKKKIGVPWVDLYQMDAEALQFPDQSFDVVFCSFAVFFFPNLERALAEFKRVLKVGGRLALSVWGKRNPLNLWVNERAKSLGAVRALRAQDIETGEALMEVLKPYFPSVKIIEDWVDFSYPTKELWWNSLWSHGSRGILEQLNEGNLRLLKSEAFDQIKAEPIPQPIQVFFALAEHKNGAL